MAQPKLPHPQTTPPSPLRHPTHPAPVRLQPKERILLRKRTPHFQLAHQSANVALLRGDLARRVRQAHIAAVRQAVQRREKIHIKERDFPHEFHHLDLPVLRIRHGKGTQRHDFGLPRLQGIRRQRNIILQHQEKVH
jgi:hypothetical protein